MKSAIATLLTICLLGVVGLSDAVAQHKAGHAQRDAQNQLPEGEQKLVARLSRFLEVPEEELTALNAQGLGWGDVEMAVLIGRAANQSPQSIAELWLTEQRGWAEVGAQFGISNIEALKGERPPEAEESDPEP